MATDEGNIFKNNEEEVNISRKRSLCPSVKPCSQGAVQSTGQLTDQTIHWELGLPLVAGLAAFSCPSVEDPQCPGFPRSFPQPVLPQPSLQQPCKTLFWSVWNPGPYLRGSLVSVLDRLLQKIQPSEITGRPRKGSQLTQSLSPVWLELALC